MICQYCGIQNYMGAMYCGYCGAPLAEIRKKRKALPMILIGSIVVVIVAVVLVFALASNSHGYDTPEEAGKAWLEAITEHDIEALKKTVHPDMLSDSIERDFYIFSSASSIDYSIKSITTTDITTKEFSRFEEAMDKVFYQDFNITAAKIVKITVVASENGEKVTDDTAVYVVKIDDKWYSFMDSRVLGYYLEDILSAFQKDS